MSSSPPMWMNLGRKLTINPLHGLPIWMLLELIINRGERIGEFLFILACKDPREGRRRCANLWQLIPDPADWGSDRGSQGETLGGWQAKAGGRERLGCLVDRIGVQPNLIDHARIENDSSVFDETFPDHPPKWNASKAVACAVLHRSTPDI
jgi:hypothetical protein